MRSPKIVYIKAGTAPFISDGMSPNKAVQLQNANLYSFPRAAFCSSSDTRITDCVDLLDSDPTAEDSDAPAPWAPSRQFDCQSQLGRWLGWLAWPMRCGRLGGWGETLVVGAETVVVGKVRRGLAGKTHAGWTQIVAAVRIATGHSRELAALA
jgi:hypothetical protein